MGTRRYPVWWLLGCVLAMSVVWTPSLLADEEPSQAEEETITSILSGWAAGLKRLADRSTPQAPPVQFESSTAPAPDPAIAAEAGQELEFPPTSPEETPSAQEPQPIAEAPTDSPADAGPEPQLTAQATVENPTVSADAPENTSPPAESEAPPVRNPDRLPRKPLILPESYEPVPLEESAEADFQAVTDRWRIVPPPYEVNVNRDRWWDPYNLNVLKGDYPIYGDDVFLQLTGVFDNTVEFRTLPTPSGVSTDRPSSERFFGQDEQFFLNHNLVVSFDLFKGSTAFKPFDWRIKGTVIGNINYLDVRENGVVNADVRRRTDRTDGRASLQEMFVEVKLADLSPNYDFVSVRAGLQPFISDFKGFVFSDTNLGARLFGSLGSSRYQYNLALFDQREKDTNSGLNRFDDRDYQRILIGNFYWQDFLVKGYTTQFSVHQLWDDASLKFDRNMFLVRPDPTGSFRPHDIEATYFGWTSFGHYERINIDHAFYYVTGHDSKNPIAGRAVTIDAFMAALELSYDRDWIRPKISYFYSSGDSDPADDEARGFDSIFDNPNFIGGGFSFWNRQAIRLALPGVALVNRGSLIPDLRSSKDQGQPNFVNPGIHIFNTGVELEVTPKVTTIFNASYLMFDTTDSLEFLLFQKPISREIGWDLSIGVRYRPFLNNNVVLLAGYSTLFPGGGFSDIFATRRNFHVAFSNVILLF